MTTHNTPLALPAPTLPETEGFGGINRNHLTTGDLAVTLRAGLYDAFLPGDRVDVYFGGSTTPIASAPVTLEGVFAFVDIPGEVILRYGSGLKEYSYTLISGLDNSSHPSDPAQILVDVDAPGNPDPGPDPINPGLAAPVVVPQVIDAASVAQGATVTVAPWSNMAVGDTLSVYWGTAVVKLVDPPVGQPVIVAIDEATIRAAGDSPNLPVSYDIVDAVSNYSKRSPSTPVNVQVSTTLFLAPKVPDAPGDVLDLGTLGGNDVRVQIDPEQDGIALGDTVVLTWKGLTGEGVPVAPVTLSQTVASTDYMIFLIPNAVAAALAQGSALLFYEVNGGDSKDRQLSIVGQAQTLAAPRIQEASGGVLDPADLIDVAHLTINPYGVMALGDTVTYYLTGKLGGSTVTLLTDSVQVSGNDLNPPKALVFTIARKEIEALAGGSIAVYYTVDTFTRALLKPSDTLVVSVAGALRLPPPTVDHVANGFLDPAIAPTGTNVRVATTYLGAVKGDLARVLWNGKDAASSYSNSFAVTPGTEVVCPIAVTFITANVNTQVNATYQIERSGQPIRYADALPFRIGRDDTPAFTIDPSTMTLKLGETAQRQATGGTTPYTYWSSDAVVATVDATSGTVTANAAGVVAIGARDAANHLATYPVTVSSATPPFAIDASMMTLKLGATGQRQATGGTTPYRYASSNAAVAAVNASTGVVTANAVGSTSITANDALNASGSYAVTVTAVAPPFTIDPSTVTLNVGDTKQRQATGGTPPYRYASSNAAVAAVNAATGVVNANAVGSTSITANDALNASGSYAVTVTAVAPPFTIDPSAVTLNVGDTKQRQATGGTPPYNYTSDTPVVATVHASTGLVTAKAAGATNITARDTANGSGSYRVTVKAIAPPLYIDPSTMQLKMGERGERQATGGVPPYAYKTSDQTVVGVGNSGGTLAIGPGSARITVSDTTNNAVSYGVTVAAPPLNIDQSPVTIKPQESFTRDAYDGVLPYTYVSSNPSVVSVSDPRKGRIFANTLGNATITVHDSASPPASKAYTVTVYTPFVFMEPNGTLNGTGAGYTRNLMAMGGTPPYRWIVTVDPSDAIHLSSTTGANVVLTTMPSFATTVGYASVKVADAVGTLSQLNFYLSY